MKVCYEISHFGLDGGPVPQIWMLPVLSELFAFSVVALAGYAVVRGFRVAYLPAATGFVAALLVALAILGNIFFCDDTLPAILLDFGHLLPVLMLAGLVLFALKTRSAVARTTVIGVVLLLTLLQGVGVLVQV